MTALKNQKSTHMIVEALFMLVDVKTRELNDLEQQIGDLLGAKDDGSGYRGHVSDAMWDKSRNIAQLAERVRKDP
jgi:hypothetical protein